MASINIVLSVITLILAIITAVLTYAMFKLNKTMTKIAEDEKQEKNGHDLSITLPTLYLGKNENTGVLNNFCIINHKNKMEAIYRIYAKEHEGHEIDFWIADNEPTMIPPYSCSYVTKNVTPSLKMFDIDKIELYAITNDCTVKLNKNIDCFNKPLEEREYKMTNISDECHQDYIRFRNENDALRIQEQSKMDNIIITCNLGLIGIAFAFMGIIFDKNPTCYLYFILAMLFSFLSIIANYYSSWCSVKDICISNVKLDERYLNGEDIHEEISTKYTKWINRLNKWAMLFLIISIAFFSMFVYVNATIKANIQEYVTMENKQTLCEGCGKNKPTVQKPMKNIKISNGAERSKPTVSKDQAQKPTGKK